MRKLLVIIILLAAYFGGARSKLDLLINASTEIADNTELKRAYQQQRSDVQVQGFGTVVKLLRDDLEGSRHQRFIVRIDNDQTILVAHNIDLADRLDTLKQGDKIEFYGEYEWNKKGGVLHWTHRDPQNRHQHGWIVHNGIRYQ
jgi:molybdopterin converting factor small subunit